MNLPAEVRHVPETGSTNQDLLDLLADGIPAIRAILADHQTAGRGRLGRHWYDEDVLDDTTGVPAAPQAMTGSIAVEWTDADPGLPLVPFAAGLAVLHVVRSVLGEGSGVGLGWPNDVIVRRDRNWRKLSGILVETAPLPARSGLWVVVGVGLNLWPVVNATPDVRARAISLSELGPDTSAVEGPKIPTNVEAFDRLIAALDQRIGALRHDPSSTMSQYRSSCVTIGERVEFQTSTGAQAGVAETVTDTGEIMIRTSQGVVGVSVGDVRAL